LPRSGFGSDGFLRYGRTLPRRGKFSVRTGYHVLWPWLDRHVQFGMRI
jgi:hypothetical protein